MGSLRIMALGLSGLGRLNQDLIECLVWEKMRVLLKRFGYASAVRGTEVLVREISCEAQGNSDCVFEGRTIAQWGLSPEAFREEMRVADIRQELDKLKAELEKANRHIVSQKQVIWDLKQYVHLKTDQEIMYRSRSMKEVLMLAEKVAPTAELQAKLLRVIQEKQVRPVGGNRFQRVRARIISATNQDLKEMAANGQFREELYFRLAVFPIFLPPLRKRREDILPLARYFLNRAYPDHEGFSPEAVHKLESYDWPGNIRELEKRYIDYVLAQTGGNKTRAAEILAISMSTLWRRMQGR